MSGQLFLVLDPEVNLKRNGISLGVIDFGKVSRRGGVGTSTESRRERERSTGTSEVKEDKLRRPKGEC